MNPLSSKAMLVRMSIHSWSGKKLDRNAASAAGRELNFVAGDDRYVKYLVPKSTLDPLTRMHTVVRAYHQWATFPWYDDGLRVLPSAGYFKYCNWIHEHRDLQQEMVEDFIRDYDTHKAYAKANRAALYKEEDYPAPEELRELFGIELNFLPFPEADDFRVQMDAETMRQLKESIEAEHVRVVTQNISTLRTKLEDKLSRVALMCSPANLNPRIYDSTIEALVTTCEMVEGLNITNDATLAATVSACNSWLNKVSPETLRTDPAVRERAYEAAMEIKEMMNG